MNPTSPLPPTGPVRASGRRTLLLGAGAMALAIVPALGVLAPWAHAADAVALPPPEFDPPPRGTAPAFETAVLAGGCFWGVQGVFQHVAGVASAVSGYTGGRAGMATYARVSTGTTGHAEAVRIVYDPQRIRYGQLLQIFFSVAHDPTQLNRQGPDDGTQYRSAIFPANAEQERVARGYIAQLNRGRSFGKPLATTIEPWAAFHPAEPYHQDFLTLNPAHPYIVAHDLPKVANLQRTFPAVYRAQPVRTGAEAGKG